MPKTTPPRARRLWVAGTVLTPALWLDPLGPFVKILPTTLLAAVTWVVLEER